MKVLKRVKGVENARLSTFCCGCVGSYMLQKSNCKINLLRGSSPVDLPEIWNGGKGAIIVWKYCIG